MDGRHRQTALYVQERRQASRAPCQLGYSQPVSHIIPPGAPVLLLERATQDPGLPELWQQIERKLCCVPVLGGGGHDLLVDERPDLIADLALLAREEPVYVYKIDLRCPALPYIRGNGHVLPLPIPYGSGLADALLLPLPRFLAQLELLDLAGGGLGQIAKLHGRRGLEAGDVLLDEVYDLLFGCLLALLEGDKRLRTLAPLLVRHGGDSSLHHGRVLGEDLFYLD